MTSGDAMERTINKPETLATSDDDIPTLTSVVVGDAPAPETSPAPAVDSDALAALEVRLTSASLDLADRLLHNAFREMEAAMFEQVSNRLRAELPDLVARIIREQFEETP
ncbi:MAG: hypothetical protein P8172_04280 [Gammaproteobacteria bacterium]|jgi:hypothetical protein